MEEIDELRAKAIASMLSSSGNPSSTPKPQSPKSREEGELSSGEEAELPTCSTVPPDVPTSDEHFLTAVLNNHAQSMKQVKALPASSSSMANMQVRASVTQKYSKHLRRKQVPFRSSNSKSLSWHSKGSDENLVINFSDDDSGSDSEESRQEKTDAKKDGIVRTNKSEVPMTSSQIQAGLQKDRTKTKLMPKKQFINPPSIPSITGVRGVKFRHLVSPAEKDPVIPRHNPIIKISARQEHERVRDAKLADQRLKSLRHEIAVRENELRVYSKSTHAQEMNAGPPPDSCGPQIMKPETKAAGISRPLSATALGLASDEQVIKRMKLHGCFTSKPTSDGHFQLLSSSKKSAYGCSEQPMEKINTLKDRDPMGCHEDDKEGRHHHADTNGQMSSEMLLNGGKGRSLVPVHGTMCSAVCDCKLSFKHDNHSMLVSDVSSSCHKSEKRDTAVDPLIIDQRSCLAQKASSSEHGVLQESDLPILGKNDERVSPANMSERIDASSLVPNKTQHNTERTQQIIAAAGFRIPLEASDCMLENLSAKVSEHKAGNDEVSQLLETSRHMLDNYSAQAAGCKLGDNEAYPQKTSLLNLSSQINIPGEAGMNLQSLLELEELQDKELEDAQELRRKCELEERRALKAYRETQRAVVDANERCSLLYRKRELFSAQLRALLMEASTSVWSSNWKRHKDIVPEFNKTVPDANFDLLSSLGHQLPAEGQNLEQWCHESNSGCPADASCQQPDGHDFVLGQCCEQDASTTDHRDISTLDGVSPPVHHPNRCIDDDENSPFDNRYVESRLACDVTERMHEQRTGDVNAEIERLPAKEKLQDFELLEASLRSKLVARLGQRASSRNNEISDAQCPAQKGTYKNRDNKESSSLFDQQIQDVDKSQMSDLEGVEMLGRSISQFTSLLPSQFHGNNFSLRNEACDNRDTEDNSSIPQEPAKATVFFLPSSVLHVASGHLKFMLPACYSELSMTEEKNAILRSSPKEATEFVPDVAESTTCCSLRSARTGDMELHNHNLAIDPFWPFCMFELRGKCNNDECHWQHVKSRTERNLQKNGNLTISCPGGQVSQALTFGKSNEAFGSPHSPFQHNFSVPTYHIGSYLIKVDSHLSQSVLAQSIWQYWQRGFCASFSLPFSVQRILPPDAPFLQTGDGPVADVYSGTRLSLYDQTLHGTVAIQKQFLQGLPESEQTLELVLELFDRKACKQDRTKVLSRLARAIEADPSSVVLWVVYLHIYYGKEKSIGKDDMFFYAVQHNEGSYELWLMYINSRMHVSDRIKSYDYALSVLCRSANAFDKERRYVSACILDIFLQMIDFVCMSGNVEKAIERIYVLPLGNSEDTLLLDIHSCLTVSDRCIFWFCCIYLAVYRKLPEVIVQQFEFEKNLPFGVEWPCAHLTTDRKERAFDLMKLAVDKMALDMDINPHREDPAALRSLHFLAVSHVRCVAALEGLHNSANLLAKYLKLYPTCIELALLSARLKESCNGNLVLRGFEESLSNWPNEIPGKQCLWNQYVEHVLADKMIDFVEKLMVRWFHGSCEDKDPHSRNLDSRKDSPCGFIDLSLRGNSDKGNAFIKKDEVFWFLNLSLYKMLQKDLNEARLVIDKALKLAAPEDFKHCVREHAAFSFSSASGSQKDNSFPVLLGLLNSYLGDCRSTSVPEPLSRKHYGNIKKPRLRQLINNLLGPVGRDFTLVNCVLEVCYGPSLLPRKVDDPKDFVDFIESVMKITPANYKLALSVYRFTTLTFSQTSVAANAIKLWASTVLINSIFQAVPVAPEYVWVEAANIMGDAENLDITLRFHEHAVSVYPFSIRLWQSYLNLSRNTGNAIAIIESARERGIELSQTAG